MTRALLVKTKEDTGPDLTAEMVRKAEASLGVVLPRSYLRLMYRVNGGVLTRPHYYLGWKGYPDLTLTVMNGIGHLGGVDGALGSRYLVPEWQYPRIGVVFCETTAAGHETVMLDYTACGPRGEPAVTFVPEVWVGGRRIALRIADSVDEFLSRLERSDKGFGRRRRKAPPKPIVMPDPDPIAGERPITALEQRRARREFAALIRAQHQDTLRELARAEKASGSSRAGTRSKKAGERSKRAGTRSRRPTT